MSTAHRIGPAHDQLLVLLARYIRATTPQLTRHSYSPNSLRHVRCYLNELKQAGYVDANKGFSQNGPPPFVYSPTMKGWRYAEEQHEMPIPARWRPSEAKLTDFRDYLHALAITDTGIAFERFCRAAGDSATLVQLLIDRFLPQTKVTLPDGAKTAMKLDMFVELHLRRGESERKKQRCHLIEIDRGTHYRKALARKFLTQILYVKNGDYQRDFGTDSLSYLWITSGGDERVKELLRIAEATMREHRLLEFAPMFRITAADPATVDPVDFFLHPSWYVPFETTSIALVAPPTPAEVIRLDSSHFMGQEAYANFLQHTGDELPTIAPELELN